VSYNNKSKGLEEIIFNPGKRRRKNKLKIMLNSTFIDLIDYRAKTLEALEKILLIFTCILIEIILKWQYYGVR